MWVKSFIFTILAAVLVLAMSPSYSASQLTTTSNVTDPGVHPYDHGLAYNAQSNRYFSTFDSSGEIYIQILDSNGNKISSNKKIYSGGPSNQRAKIVSGTNTLLVYFESIVVSGNIAGEDIKGVLIDTNGNTLAQLNITANPSRQTDASAAYDPVLNWFFIVWLDERNFQTKGVDIWGRAIDASNGALGGEGTIITSTGNSHEAYPDMVFDPANNLYYIAFTSEIAGSNAISIWGYAVNNNNGQQAIPPFRISNLSKAGPSSRSPVIALTGPRSIMVAWEERPIYSTDITAQYISISSSPPITASLSGKNIVVTSNATEEVIGSLSADIANNRQLLNYYLLMPPNYNSPVMGAGFSGQSLSANITYTYGGSSPRSTFSNKYLATWISPSNDLLSSFVEPNFAFTSQQSAPIKRKFLAPTDQSTKDNFNITAINVPGAFANQQPSPLNDGDSFSEPQFIFFNSSSLGLRLMSLGLFNATDVDARNMKLSADASRTATDFTNTVDIAPFFLLVPNTNNGAGVRYCSVGGIPAIAAACANETLFTGPFPQNKTIGSIFSYVQLSAENKSYMVQSTEKAFGAGLIGPQQPRMVLAVEITNTTPTNFTYSTSLKDSITSVNITTGTCLLSFTSPNNFGPFNMPYNQTTNKYAAAVSQQPAQAYNYSIACNAPNYAQETATGTVNLQTVQQTDSPPSANLITPSTNAVIGTNSVSLTCSATDDKGLSEITLYDNVAGSWKADQTKQASGTTATVNFKVDNVANGNYLWACSAKDTSGQTAFSTVNNTFTVNFQAPAGCTEKWNCTDFTECVDNRKTRVCTDDNKCSTTNNKPNEQEACISTSVCTEDWSCGDWSNKASACGTRVCTDRNSCGTTAAKPQEAHKCEASAEGIPIVTIILIIILIVAAVAGFLYLKKRRGGGDDEEGDEELLPPEEPGEEGGYLPEEEPIEPEEEK